MLTCSAQLTLLTELHLRFPRVLGGQSGAVRALPVLDNVLYLEDLL